MNIIGSASSLRSTSVAEIRHHGEKLGVESRSFRCQIGAGHQERLDFSEGRLAPRSLNGERTASLDTDTNDYRTSPVMIAREPSGW